MLIFIWHHDVHQSFVIRINLDIFRVYFVNFLVAIVSINPVNKSNVTTECHYGHDRHLQIPLHHLFRYQHYHHQH